MTYILPSATTPIPGGLTLTQFLQTLFVGLTGIAGSLVRPSWQKEPPQQPDGSVNWMSFGIANSVPDANAFIGTDADGVTKMGRHETLEITTSFYGPEALTYYALMRDGFQIQPNLASLQLANMGFKEVTEARRIPDLIHQVWVDRFISAVFIRREIVRTYPILTIISVSGTIHTVLGNEEYLLPFGTPQP